MSSVVYGGLDVHKETIVAFLVDSGTGEVHQEEVPSDRAHVLRAVRRWGKLGELRLCYEASGSGYVLKRWLDEEGVACEVVAPSSVLRVPGKRVKTDRRDARTLAQQYAAGMLSIVRTPSVAEERARAVVRLHDELTRDLTRTKNRITKLLLRLGLRYEGGHNWTREHRRWLASQALVPDEQLILHSHLSTLDHLQLELDAVDKRIAALAQEAPYAEGVARLLSLRGIGVYSAMVLLSEIGDIERFGSAPQLMSYFGLVPCESSSGEKRRLGGITKAGNSAARWVLAQAAWNQTRPLRGERLRKHWLTQPPEVVAIGRKAAKRLHQKFWKIAARKERNIAATAVARELAGFVWAILRVEVGSAPA
jgi:transposase